MPSLQNEKYKDEYKKLYNIILNNQQMIEIQKAVKSLKKSNKIIDIEDVATIEIEYKNNEYSIISMKGITLE